MWITVSTENAPFSTKETFLSAIDVFINRPNILNDRIIGAKIIEESTLTNLDFLGLDEIETTTQSLSLLETNQAGSITINSVFANASSENGCLSSLLYENNYTGTLLVRRRLFPKLPEKFVEFEDLVIIDSRQDITVTVLPLLSCLTDKQTLQVSPKFPYAIRYEHQEENIISLLVLESDAFEKDTPSLRWLRKHVFLKVLKWSNQPVAASAPLPSLSLIPIEKYCSHRQRLKTRYSKEIIQKWQETTDPLKFVYEDISIAAYLMTLWECERENTGCEKKQSFVDLGCGNGLLVYILASEGHHGLGLDIRKRKIWDMYGQDIILKESSLVPSKHCLFPEYDWLIGNHSDELTPWIPIIAARSSYNMKVFLLPCCAFTFDGKYQRTFPGSSQYQSYLNFVHDLCQNAGFTTCKDKLRIPSTKRICFVCSSRTYPECEEKERDEIRKKYISKHSRNLSSSKDIDTSLDLHENETSKWKESFKPREKIEPVRNCTQLGRIFLEATVNTLAQILLLEGDQCREVKTDSGPKMWHFGGFLSLGELANRLGSEVKQQLKQQCGGLQTLLRNHRHIFQISDGLVCVTTPLRKSDEKPVKTKNNKPGKSRIDSQPCWFHNNHPQHCPLSDSECKYSHRP